MTSEAEPTSTSPKAVPKTPDADRRENEPGKAPGPGVIVTELATPAAAGEGLESPDAKPDLPGVYAALGALPGGAIVFEEGLAKMLHKHPVSIKRAVARGELPRPMRLFGKPAWTAGALVRHLEAKLAEAAREAEQERGRLAKLSP
jgi:hypothetical protein